MKNPKRLFVSLFALSASALLSAASTPLPAHADSFEWFADEPKGAGNTPCVGRADYGGHQYTYGNWAPTDADPTNEFDRRAYCHRILVTDMQMFYRHKLGLELPPTAVRVLSSP